MGKHRATLAPRPRLEVSDIFRSFGHLLEPLSVGQAKVVRAITNCRTVVLGGHKLTCDHCDHVEFAYNSCRNRHCPKCQYLARQRWVRDRVAELLPVPYFHVVFTVPHILNSVAYCNKKIFYNLLFTAMSETLKEVAEKRLKANLGFTAVLHTWGQNLILHPHVHAIVPGGGLSLDGKKWISCKPNYLLPLKVLARVFRGKFLSELENVYQRLNFPGKTAAVYNDPKEFKDLLIRAAQKDWVIYAKAPFAGPKQVINYLGGYTHRIAISNHRIKKVDGATVTFSCRDNNGSKTKLLTLSHLHFMRRFLLHVLPAKFTRLRHYGWLASRIKQKELERIRSLLNVRAVEKTNDKNWRELLARLTGIDVTLCPQCKKGKLVETTIIESVLKKWDSS